MAAYSLHLLAGHAFGMSSGLTENRGTSRLTGARMQQKPAQAAEASAFTIRLNAR
jgi:hypothetical protein